MKPHLSRWLATAVAASGLAFLGFAFATAQSPNSNPPQNGRAQAAAEAAARRQALEAAGCGPGHAKVARTINRNIIQRPEFSSPVQLAQLADAAVIGYVTGIGNPYIDQHDGQISTDFTVSVDRVLRARGPIAAMLIQGRALSVIAFGGVVATQDGVCTADTGPGILVVAGGRYIILIFLHRPDGSLEARYSRLWFAVTADDGVYPLNPRLPGMTQLSSAANFEAEISNIGSAAVPK
jgi:hypothetical protein